VFEQSRVSLRPISNMIFNDKFTRLISTTKYANGSGTRNKERPENKKEEDDLLRSSMFISANTWVANSGQQNSLVFKCVSLIEMANLLPAIREEVADAVKEAVHRRLPRQSPSQMLLHWYFLTESGSEPQSESESESETQSIKLP